MPRAGSLDDYNARRDFSATREPPGRRGQRRRASGLAFVVQKHDATRLHYDLRLEWGGVLKSWAVTRGPSLDPSDKRLAVMTEDHPLAYGSFEGTIPRKAYGGGTVMLWDRGTWEPLGDPDQGLSEGKLRFVLHGERMKGGWALVRMRRKAGEKRDNWLLIKDRDAVAEELDGRSGDTLTSEHATSIATGRSMEAIAAGHEHGPAARDPSASAGPGGPRPARKRAAPDFREPQLATLVAEAPEGDDWLHEVKFDGYRLLASVGAGGVTMRTRTGLDWTDRFRGIAEALEGLGCDSALIDGEVVAADFAEGKSAFSALRRAITEDGAMRFHAFDLLSLDGEDLAPLPLAERKARLQALLRTVDDARLRYSEHVTGHGAHVFRQVCAAGEEGIMSKRADQPYRGGRGQSWLKVKCTRRQEFVIGGYSPSDRRGRAFASLLMGTMEDGRLVYRGRVGSGFDAATLDRLGAEMARRARKTSPFASVPAAIARTARWVRPDLVAEVDFAEFTDDGHVRHGTFLGLRDDKKAPDVTLEDPMPDTGDNKPGGEPSSRKARPAGGETVEVFGIRISSPDRVVFPLQGVTKLDLARYHAVVGERMLAHLAGRPVSLLRCPEGRKGQCFFQKHAGDGFAEAIHRIPVRDKSGETKDYMEIGDAEGLVAAVQMGTVEFHIWGSRADRLERPDRMVFDLDPGDGVTFAVVREAAMDLRARLDGIGLASLAMVTGGKGIHVVVPIARRSQWEEVKGFASGLAKAMAEEEPERFVATMSKARRKGRIFIDWLRNERGATAIAPYSTRAREGGPVAVPVGWDELEDIDAANAFSMRDVLDRLEASDPWAEASGWRQSLTKAMLERV